MTSRTLLPLAVALAVAAACAKTPPTARPTTAPPVAFPGAGGSGTGGAPPPPVDVPPPPPVPVDPVVSADPLANKSLDDLNRESPLRPVFFVYDSDELDAVARQTLNENARILRQYPTWVITVEGHCDERGTAEYNLALGDRRALAARTYLISLGIPADQIRTVSYGKEFPFDPGHDEAAWSLNRRAHFTVTAK